MKNFLYLTVLFACTVVNSASQSLAFAALSISFKYNIPISALMQANNDPSKALTYLSLKELGEVKCT